MISKQQYMRAVNKSKNPKHRLSENGLKFRKMFEMTGLTQYEFTEHYGKKCGFCRQSLAFYLAGWRDIPPKKANKILEAVSQDVADGRLIFGRGKVSWLDQLTEDYFSGELDG